MKGIKVFFERFLPIDKWSVDWQQIDREIEDMSTDIDISHFPTDQSRMKMIHTWTDYASMLVGLSQYEKALPLLHRCIRLYETDSSIPDPWKEEIYVNLIYYRAQCFANTQKIEYAISEMNKLIERFPLNDQYKKDLFELRYPFFKFFSLHQVISLVLICAGILMYLIYHYNKSIYTRAVFLLVLIGIIYYHINWRRKKKREHELNSD